MQLQETSVFWGSTAFLVVHHESLLGMAGEVDWETGDGCTLSSFLAETDEVEAESRAMKGEDSVEAHDVVWPPVVDSNVRRTEGLNKETDDDNSAMGKAAVGGEEGPSKSADEDSEYSEGLEAADEDFGDQPSLKRRKTGGFGKMPKQQRRRWLNFEDQELISRVEDFLEASGGKTSETRIPWSGIADKVEGRNAKQCRDRWLALNKTQNKRIWTMEEDLKLLRLYRMNGNRWVRIASEFRNRNDNMIKSRFRVLKRMDVTEQLLVEQIAKHKKNTKQFAKSKRPTSASSNATASQSSNRELDRRREETHASGQVVPPSSNTVLHQQYQRNFRSRSSQHFQSETRDDPELAEFLRELL